MIDHIGIQVADVEAALAFYLRAFEAIGFPHDGTFVVGLSGRDGVPSFWLSRGTATETRELHLAFRAAGRAEVDAVHRAAVAAGAEVLHAPPRVAGIPPRLLRRVPARSRWPQCGGRLPRQRLTPVVTPGLAAA